MIIIHAAQLAGQLTLWGEDSDQPSQSDRAPDRRHPRCAGAGFLAEAAGVTLEDHTRVETRAPYQEEATIWLPSRGNSPMPSEALAGPAPKSRAKPRIKPWCVPVVRLSGGQAIELLQRSQNGRVLAPGVVLGPDAAYWRHVMLFAAGLTVRQQFLPNVIRRGDGTEAVWTPLYVGDDAHRLAELASAMPASARAMTTTSKDRLPSTPPQAVLKEFIASFVNHMVRQDAKGGTPEFDSAYDAWLHALTTAGGEIHAANPQLQQLRRQVAEWHRPIAVAANSLTACACGSKSRRSPTRTTYRPLCVNRTGISAIYSSPTKTIASCCPLTPPRSENHPTSTLPSSCSPPWPRPAPYAHPSPTV